MEVMRRAGLILFFSFFASVSANAATTVYWGGVSFSNWEARQSNYPNISKFLCRSGACADAHLDGIALDALDVASFKNLRVSMDYIQTRAIEGVIMTPVISAETINAVRDVSNGKESFIYTFRIFGSLTFFEFGSGRFIAAKPFLSQFTETLPTTATEEQIEEAFLSMLRGKSGPGFFELMFTEAANIDLSKINEKYVRLSEVTIAPDALDALKLEGSPEVWTDLVARVFESFLVRDTGAFFVPFAGSDELTTEISATFADGSKVIKLPSDVPFEVSVAVKRMKELEKVDRKAKTVCHAVALGVEVNTAFDTVLDAQIARTRESCGVVALDKELQASYYFTQSVLSLLNETSKSLNGAPDPDFLKRAMPKVKSAKRDFKNAYKEAFKSDW